MAAVSFADVIVANIRGIRARKALDQADVAERMRGLGYANWYAQTVGKVEKGERRLLASELVGLTLALQTTIPDLLAATDDAVSVAGGAVEARSAANLAHGRNDGAVRWDGNKPVLGRPVYAWRGEMEDDPALTWDGA
jgi:hypothetical protein